MRVFMDRVPFLSEGELAAMTAIVVALVVLVSLANDCADAGTRRSANDGSLETASEERAKNGTAARSDKGTFAGPDTALVAVAIIVAIVITRIVVMAVAATVANPIVEIGVVVSIVSVLGGDGEDTGRQKERDDEYSLAYLHHLTLDACSWQCG
jgi:hypothetical protein